MLFTLRLAQIKLSEDRACEDIFDVFLKPNSVMEPSKLGSDCLDGRLTKTQLAQLEDLMLTPYFKGLADDLRINEEKWV